MVPGRKSSTPYGTRKGRVVHPEVPGRWEVYILRYPDGERCTPYGTRKGRVVHTLWYPEGKSGTHPVHTQVGEVYTLYIPRWERCTPCIYALLGMVGGSLPWYIPFYTTLGIPACSTVPGCTCTSLHRMLSAGWRSPGL